MTTQNKNFKNMSGGSRNYVLSMYIHLKSPKSHDTVPLRVSGPALETHLTGVQRKREHP